MYLILPSLEVQVVSGGFEAKGVGVLFEFNHGFDGLFDGCLLVDTMTEMTVSRKKRFTQYLTLTNNKGRCSQPRASSTTLHTPPCNTLATNRSPASQALLR